MQNLTELSVNATFPKSFSMIVKVCVVIPLFCLFLGCIAVMLQIFASHRQFLDTSRYILFAHMLVNDTLQILSSVLLFLCVMGQVKFPLLFCVPLLFVSTGTFQNTTLILAAMSLERYVAILNPLHRPASWRPDRIWIIVLSLWSISFIFPIIEFSIGKHNPAVDVLSSNMLCKATVINSSPTQGLYRLAVNVLFFAVVGVIILFTYVRILLEARKPISETLIVLHTAWLAEDVAFFNYFCFILMPRFLSPLIYGFRDQNLRKHIRKRFLCCTKIDEALFKH